MKNHLHHIAIRVTAVKASRSIAMCPRLLENFYVMAEQEIVPGINVLYFRQDKANMVQVLRACWRFISPMQRKVVVAGCQVDIVGVRSPFDLHTQQVDIKVFGLCHSGDVKCYMSHA